MSGKGCTVVHGRQGTRCGSAVRLGGQTVLDEGSLCGSGSGSADRGRAGSKGLCQTQLPDWSGDDGSPPRYTVLANQDTGQVGECGIHQVHPDSTRYTAGGSKPTHAGHSHINEHVTSWILLNPSLLFNI